MTSFLRYLLYMLALLTAKNPEEVSAGTDKVIVMDEFGNRSQQPLQQQHQQQQQQQPSNLFHHQGYYSQYQRHTQQQIQQQGHDPNIQSDSPADHQCGGILKKSRYGIIHTPNFPNKFPVPITCVWIIDASDLVTGPNISIVVYLTQLYVLGGLKFTEYMYYGDDYKVPSHSVFEMTEDDVTQVAWIQFNSPYLEIRFTMKTLDGTHLRALDRLLDVYGFNITYEVDIVKPYQCNALQCRFLGHCYAEQDFTSYYCSCFPGFSGSDCGKGPLCENPDINFCENGGTCKHIGDAAVTCLCPSGYKGNKCEIPEIYDLTSCTPQSASDCQQQCILTQPDSSTANSPCSCNNFKKGIPENAPANRSGKTRYEVTIRLGSNLTYYRNMESSERRANEHHLTTLLEKHVSYFFLNLTLSYLFIY